MKSSKIAMQNNIQPYLFDSYLKKQTKIPVKETVFGDLLIPDDVDVASLIASFLEEEKQKKEQNEQKHREKLQQEEKERLDEINKERVERERQYSLRMNNLKANHHEGYYEYKVISLSDVGGLFSANSGRVDVAKMTAILNDMGLDGWHLVIAYSNELGKNALSGGAGGVMLGVNSTVDENILIFERFIRFV